MASRSFIALAAILALQTLSSHADTIKTDSSVDRQDFSWTSGFKDPVKGPWISQSLIQLNENCTWIYSDWSKASITIQVEEQAPILNGGQADPSKGGKVFYTGKLNSMPNYVGYCSNVSYAKGEKDVMALDNVTLTWLNVEMNSSRSSDRFILDQLDIWINNTLDLKRGYWIFNGKVKISGPPNFITNETVELPLVTNFMTAAYDVNRPANDKFSFSCVDLQLKTRSFKSTFDKQHGGEPLEPKTILKLSRFQIQPFSVQNYKFRQSFDCSTWFTIPLWMGLFAVLLFFIIVSSGTYLLSTINVMDRFEDPKGKPLPIKAE